MISDSKIEAARAAYLQDGAAVLRDVISTQWIDRLGVAMDELRNDGAAGIHVVPSARGGAFWGGLFNSLRVPEFAAFVRETDLAEIAGRVLEASTVRFFYDQTLVKEPGTSSRTSWHQDLSYWPVVGEQIISLWVPIDPATPETGVVTYVRGSHKWNQMFVAQPFSDDEGDDESIFSQLELPKNDAGETIYASQALISELRTSPEKFDLITWDVEPGDVIIHHPLVVHGAPSNKSATQRRRALATRWLGDDVRWDDTRPNFLREIGKMPYFEQFNMPDLNNGDLVNDPLFPVLWGQDSQSNAA